MAMSDHEHEQRMAESRARISEATRLSKRSVVLICIAAAITLANVALLVWKIIVK